MKLRLLIASMGAESLNDGIEAIDPAKKEELLEKIRQFDAKLALDKERLKLEKEKHNEDVRLKEKALNKPTVTRK